MAAARLVFMETGIYIHFDTWLVPADISLLESTIAI